MTADFDNIGDLKVGSPVTMSGVSIGEVDVDPLRLEGLQGRRGHADRQQYNEIPDDSFASIQTQGLLGGKYIGLSPGGADTFLKNGSHIDQTQSAIVLESLINKLFASFASKAGGDSQSRARARARRRRDAQKRSPRNENFSRRAHRRHADCRVSAAVRRFSRRRRQRPPAADAQNRPALRRS